MADVDNSDANLVVTLRIFIMAEVGFFIEPNTSI